MGDLLVVLSSVPLSLSVLLLFNRHGALVDWSGSVGALRGVRVRGTCFLVGLLMLGAGLTLGLQQGWTATSGAVAGFAAGAMLVFAAYRPATVFEEQVGRRHRAPKVRLDRAARARSAAAFGCSAVAAVVLIAMAVF
ncbi:hypothetical protein [Cellulomonas sp. PhB150]|uniref:hypothetical protein n=1 Tax=Cellulomonas sp. PhB150 TaxID=2485188 RepID=UPI000F48CF8A|nr:hypothetical protein [Cellulomonas sp. PhB150]